ncbi:hypothetical protein Syun_025424 [Stephania yunnanensis]|uniref:Uncharacterized protein n=1 Tax=Stephania yunnanensis TaxID=152371 RepID=A0AAP0F0J1_9MAGN
MPHTHPPTPPLVHPTPITQISFLPLQPPMKLCESSSSPVNRLLRRALPLAVPLSRSCSPLPFPPTGSSSSPCSLSVAVPLSRFLCCGHAVVLSNPPLVRLLRRALSLAVPLSRSCGRALQPPWIVFFAVLSLSFAAPLSLAELRSRASASLHISPPLVRPLPRSLSFAVPLSLAELRSRTSASPHIFPPSPWFVLFLRYIFCN